MFGLTISLPKLKKKVSAKRKVVVFIEKLKILQNTLAWHLLSINQLAFNIVFAYR